jgi:AraC family ethanolamine operon transcriptional activator
MLSAAGVIETRDVEELRMVFEPWDVFLYQMSPGSFRGRLEYVQVNRILLYREHWTRRVVGGGSTPSGYYMFGSPSSPETRIDWCGTTIGPTRLAFARPSTEFEFVTPEGCDHVVLLLPETLLYGHLGEQLVREASSRVGHYLQCHADLGDELVRMVHRLIDDSLENDAMLADDQMRKAVELQLLGTIGQAIEATSRVTESLRRNKRRLALLKAIRHSERLRRPTSVPALAAASGVTQRVLELQFQQTVQVSPRRFLLWSRMNGARRDLLTAEAETTMISKIAVDWGFSDFGRFAVEYKKLFGESPSSTLARHARPGLTRLADVL